MQINIRLVATLSLLTAMGMVHTVAGGEEMCYDLGRTDASAQNDFWQAGRYSGVKVFRSGATGDPLECRSRMAQASAALPVDTRFRTCDGSRIGVIRTSPPGLFINFR